MTTTASLLLRAAVLSVVLAVPGQVLAQGYVDPEMRVEQLEGQLRRLTGQNEELQYRNRQLEEQLRALQAGGAPVGAPQAAAMAPAGSMAVQAPMQSGAQAPIIYPEAPAQSAPGQGRRRNDQFNPVQNPNAPGVPRALGGGNLPLTSSGAAAPGEPLPLNQGAARAGGGESAGGGGLTTLPPSANPKDEFDLGIGYMQRRDYALAEETLRDFEKRHPGDPLTADAQYWLGESFFQRQLYRDAAEAFLAVTTKYDTSAKAPDSLLRLGQSLAALKEKEAACAALGEVTREYPRASQGVKQSVDREQKRNKC